MKNGNLFLESDRSDIIIRLRKLRPDAKPLWGKMNASETLAHMADPVRVTLGIRSVPFRKNILSSWPMKQLVLNYLPFPKGAPTADEFILGKGGTPPNEFDKDLNVLVELLDEFKKLEGRDDLPYNPVFGQLNAEEWSRLHWKHIDHHLRQFGL